jgi:hypothetical protein
MGDYNWQLHGGWVRHLQTSFAGFSVFLEGPWTPDTVTVVEQKKSESQTTKKPSTPTVAKAPRKG